MEKIGRSALLALYFNIRRTIKTTNICRYAPGGLFFVGEVSMCVQALIFRLKEFVPVGLWIEIQALGSVGVEAYKVGWGFRGE